MFTPDSSIIHRHGAHEVLASHHEVMWRDGSRLQLHPVLISGHDQKWLRAFNHGGLHWVVVDLRKLAPLGQDLCLAAPRDVPGIVFYSLRHEHANAAACIVVALQHFDAAWMADEALAA